MENLRNLHPALFVLGALVGLLQHSMPLWAEEVSLFDGRTLQGWDYTEGVWRVEDGAVTAGSYEKKFPRNEFICTKKVYANFELKLKIKCSGDPKTGLINSGIQIRSARLPNGGAAGYQVDCGKGWFGKIYDENRRGLIYPGPVDEPTLLKAVDTYHWNEYRILAEGPRIQVWINGIKASDYTEKNPNIPLDGVIAPQIHSGGHVVVQFKDITIRELPATPGAPTWESLGGATAALAKIQKPKARQTQPQAPKRPGKKTQSGRTEAWNPEEERAGFKVPPGFKIELVASEEHGVINPIDLTFDDAGRLWTQTAQMYPLDPVTGIKWGDLLRLMDNEDAQANNPDFQRIRNLYRLKSKGQDKILILDDITKPASKPLHVWADGLTIPQSILPYKDGAYVCHGSELFLLRDTDNDGKSDKMEPVLGGFGFTDTHTMAHLLIRGPGKYIHFSHGALNKGLVTAVASGKQARVDAACQVRFGLDHQDFEVISSGPNNMWGLQLRANGQWYGSEANDIGYSVTPWEPGSAIGGVAWKTIRPYQPTLPAPHKFRVGGTGLSGLAFPDDSAGCFPVDDWKDVALLANPITSTVNAVRVFRNPDGTVGSEHLPDFLTSQDDWFRPVNLEFGPDGCLYIADFYNKIISHNEVTTAHPDRDKSHGRIWRVRHDNQEPRKIPDVTKAGPEELLAHLKSPLLWEKRAAWHQIADRGITSLAKDLSNLAADSKEDPVTRIHALWSLEESGHFDRQLVDTLLASENGDLRREAIRSLATFDIAPDTVASLVAGFIHDDNCMVRSQTIRTLGDLDNATPSVIAVLVDACKPALDGNQFGGSYERNLERFLARMALEKSSAALAKYLSKKSGSHPAENVLWATQALDEQTRGDVFLGIWANVDKQKLDAETFVAITEMLSNPKVLAGVRPFFQDPAQAANMVSLALANQSRVTSKQFVSLLTPQVSRLLERAENQALGLQAVGKFRIAGLAKQVAKLEPKDGSPGTLRLHLSAWKVSPGSHVEAIKEIAGRETLPVDLRVEAAHALLPVTQEISIPIVRKLLKSAQPQQIANELSSSKPGAGLLCELFQDKAIPLEAFDLSAAERIHQSYPDNPSAKAILANAHKRLAERRSQAQARIHQLQAYISKNPGDPSKGQATFASCLTCHRVGDTGQDIAPPLDGSGHRELEHLLTAIVDPDAAIEGNYGLYRITKTDGSVVEGYLDKKEALGTTIAVMGGSRIFVPMAEIQKASFVGGRSFMPPAFGQLPQETMADLVAYIATLKTGK